MRKALLGMLFVVILINISLAALTQSIDSRSTWDNAYRWTGHPAKDKILAWAVELEDAVDGLDSADFQPTDITALETITWASQASTSTLTSNSGAEDLTISLAGATDSSLILQSAGTGADALSLISSAASISAVSADNITLAAADDITADTTDGGIVLTAAGAANGDISLISADDVIVTAAGAFTLSMVDVGTFQGSFLPLTITKQTVTTGSLSTADCGYVNQVAVDSQTITLPATVAGVEFTIQCTAADGAALVTVELDNSDKFIGAGLTPADGEALLLTKATQNIGDYIKVSAHTDGWIITELVGTWAEASP